MTARLEQKTRSLLGYVVRPLAFGGFTIGFVANHRTKQIMTKRRRARERRMWRQEADQ